MALLALREYQLFSGSAVGSLVNAISGAGSWLVSSQHGDGGWGSEVSGTVYETGFAAHALALSSYPFDTSAAM